MFKLFWIKEKQSIILNIIYVFTLLSFGSSLNNGSTGVNFSFGIVAYLVLIPELFRFSLLNLSYFFARGGNSSIFKGQLASVETNIKLLSIKMSTFIKYNIVYTVLRLLPFWIIALIVNPEENILLGVGVLSLSFLVKAYVGPTHTVIITERTKVYTENKDLDKKEKKEKMITTLSNKYKGFNYRIYSTYIWIFTIGYFAVLSYSYIIVFPGFLGAFHIPFNPIYLFVVGLATLIIYGVYINRLEFTRENELYQQ